ncbi:hypothetical protein BJ165DRAFT_929554 [Panaeolus papilionaceus]|nr:hypothetical protein BJ165DRAFT_929554 [Panaeolus papilionaceus]
MILPQDIIDCIIAQFGRKRPRPRDLLEDYHSLWTPLVRPDDIPDAMATLKSLSLVSRDCRRAAIRYTFYTVDITGGDRDSLFRRLKRFYNFLSTSLSQEQFSLEPRAATCIRTLSIGRYIMDSLNGQGTSADYLLGDSLLTKIFELLDQDCMIITCLRIDNSLTAISVGWDQIPISFRTSFQALVRSPNLKILSLLNIKDVPHTLFHKSSIKAVELAICSNSYAQLRSISEEYIFDLPKIDFLVTNDKFSLIFIKAPWWRDALVNLKGCNIDTRYEIDSDNLEFTRHSLETLRVDSISVSIHMYARQLIDVLC